MTQQDIIFMQEAIKLAQYAEKKGEVPVGAILVLNNQIIGSGWNCPISSCDSTAHAEIISLREAAQKIQNYRLVETVMYVTLEPCAMCAGALIHARIKRLVFGASDPKSGAIKSIFNLLDSPNVNHKIQYECGVLKKECGEILKNFFKEKRQQKLYAAKE